MAVLVIPAGVALASGILATFWRPGPYVRSLLQHFAAGVVTAALAVEILPEIEARHPSISTSLGGFALGGALVFAMKWVFSRLERRRNGDLGPATLIAATAIDVAVDGLVIGMGVAVSHTTGMTLSIGFSAELLSLGFAVATAVGTNARWLSFAVTVGLGGVLVGGGLLGAYGIGGAAEPVRLAGLSFGAAAILYLVTEELLVEAHEVPPRGPAGAGLLLVGFLCYWAIRYATNG